MNKVMNWLKNFLKKPPRPAREVRRDLDLFLENQPPQFRRMWRARMRAGLSDSEADFVRRRIAALHGQH